MKLKTKLAASALLLGSVSGAQAALVDYTVNAIFTEPQAMYDTEFNGIFTWDTVAQTMVSFSGTMNSSMSVPTNTPNITLNQNFLAENSASVGNAAGMTTFSIFKENTSTVYAGADAARTPNHYTGEALAAGRPGLMMMGIGADTVNAAVQNAYFSLTFDTASGPLSASVLDMVYGDCTPAGMMMMNNVCMTGYGGVIANQDVTGDGIPEPVGAGSMYAYASSLTITEVAAVPVPAAAWLFGGALMSLFGVNRRKSVLPA